MHRLLTDLRYGVRMLLKTPSATATVLLALSLGIGLSALTFSLINGAVLTSLPVEGGDRIVRIGRAEPVTWGGDDYAAWSQRQRSFEHIGGVEMTTVTLAIDGSGTESVMSAAITPSILPLLATAPALGRPFTDADAVRGAPAVVLVSHNVWRDRLGSDPNALGAVVRVNGRPAQIVGVMPEGFGFPWNQKVWAPLDLDPIHRDRSDDAASESKAIVGRLREGISAKVAEREMTAITRELDKETRGASGPASVVTVTSYTDLFSERGQSAALAALMLGIAFLVLLVACANVASVLLARAIDRRREIAVRLALGATRGRIIAQLLAEIFVLTAAGAAGGVAIALVGARFVAAAMPVGMPYWIGLRIDLPVLAFVAMVAVIAALMAGLMPALQSSRSHPHDVLKETGRGSSSLHTGRVMRRLIAVEMALSFVLLVLAGLFIKSAVTFRATQFAFAPENVYTAIVRLPETTYGDAAAQARFSEQVREKLSGLPEVTGVALATAVPGVGSSAVAPVDVEGNVRIDGEKGVPTRSIIVTPGFFALFRASVVDGRDFDTRDRPANLPVAIVNEAFATRHFPAGALGRRIRFAEPNDEKTWLTIVGVTSDLMAGGVERDVPEAVYLPLAQNPRSELQILARPRISFASLPAPIRESLTALDSDVALFNVLALDVVIDQANSQYTWFSILFLISGGIALFLAAIGLYGVMAFWVIQRTREIGVRMALGGQNVDIVRLVLGQGMKHTAIGLLVGVVLALPAARVLGFALYGVAPYDPTVFVSILAVLAGAGTLGCWLPARRATRMNPVEALAAD